jgi:hypothetical protein
MVHVVWVGEDLEFEGVKCPSFLFSKISVNTIKGAMGYKVKVFSKDCI